MGIERIFIIILTIIYIKYVPKVIKETKEETGNNHLYRIQNFIAVLTIIFFIASLKYNPVNCMNVALLLMLCSNAVEKIMTKTGNAVLYSLQLVITVGLLILCAILLLRR